MIEKCTFCADIRKKKKKIFFYAGNMAGIQPRHPTFSLNHDCAYMKMGGMTKKVEVGPIPSAKFKKKPHNTMKLGEIHKKE